MDGVDPVGPDEMDRAEAATRPQCPRQVGECRHVVEMRNDLAADDRVEGPRL